MGMPIQKLGMPRRHPDWQYIVFLRNFFVTHFVTKLQLELRGNMLLVWVLRFA